MSKPAQADIAVIGVGIGMLSFATGGDALSPPVLISPAAARWGLDRLRRQGTNEDLESEISQRLPLFAGLAPRRL